MNITQNQTFEQEQGLSQFETAQNILKTQDYTCVLCKDAAVYTTTLRGVKPLMQWLESGIDLRGFSAADKVVGRATAFLYSLLGVTEVYAHVMSKAALDVLQKAGIHAKYGELTEYIINRKGDGICPFEEAVLEIETAEAARIAIRNKMVEMNISLD